MCLVFLRAGLCAIRFDEEDRRQYVEAQRMAYDGGLGPLVGILATMEARSSAQALGLGEEASRDADGAHAARAAAAGRFRTRLEARVSERAKVFDMSARLESAAEVALRGLAPRLSPDQDTRGEAPVTVARGANARSFEASIVTLGRALGCYPDTRTYLAWVGGTIGKAEVAVAFHSLGVEFVGLMVATAYLHHGTAAGGGGSTPAPLCREAFDFWFNEDPREVEDRFRVWLDEVVAAARSRARA